ncbi:MAG: ABC transporter substrate-binding protein [Leptolyngbya foveolarum]|uniref:ABC transporter substrate-binding protein n=1 Tax=Leptolyngbya foveolarum TaxID=47253 RepID=A0A2W4W886_9CYAN|nr:MAG: ABC transporter substrate-binding protein [Leptolyngbya foveolarum]
MHSRRLIPGLLTVIAFSLASCGNTDSQTAEEGNNTATATGEKAAAAADAVVSYNSPEEWANWGAVLKAFTQKTGIEAPSDPKNSGQTLAALQAESASPQADTAYYGIVFGIEAKEAGLVEAYQPPGFDEIPATLKDPDGEWMTVHQGAIAFLVNTDELGDTPVPQCWEDLTGDEYAGKVGFLDPTQSAVGYSVSTAANLALGGTLDNWNPGIEYLAALQKNGLILPAQTATAMVQQGEIPILIDADFNGYKLKNIDQAPIEVVLPCEGTISVPYVMSLVKNAPRRAAGTELMDFVLSDEGQQLFAESYLRPIRSVEIDEKIAAQMLPESEYERVTVPDFAEMRDVQDTFVGRWQSEVVQ